VAKLPDPQPGLVFRYDYLRFHEASVGVENGKERPACILLRLAEGEIVTAARIIDEEAGEQLADYVAGPRDVLVVLIQSDPPNQDQLGIALTLETKRLIGLPTTTISYVIVSELNIDTWPNAGIKAIPGQAGQFAYPGRMPGPILAAMARAVLRLRDKRLLLAVARHS
jgi:hypothetical protein